MAIRRNPPVRAQGTAREEDSEPARDPPEKRVGRPEVDQDSEPGLMEGEDASEKSEER